MSMERIAKMQLVSVVILVVVLVAGFLVGVAWDRSVRSDSVDTTAPTTQTEGDRRERSGRRLIVEQVGLSAEQKARVDSLVAYHRDRMEALQREVAPRYRAIIEATRESIKDVLTPDQRAQYDSLLAEHDRRRRERRDGNDDQR